MGRPEARNHCPHVTARSSSEAGGTVSGCAMELLPASPATAASVTTPTAAPATGATASKDIHDTGKENASMLLLHHQQQPEIQTAEGNPLRCSDDGAVAGEAKRRRGPSDADADADTNGATPEVAGNNDKKKPSRGAVALIMTPLCLSVMLSALDLTIVTPAIPSIVADFRSPNGYIWIGGVFILAYTAVTPVWGSVADIWGRKPIMLTALSIFLGASLLCALAPDIDALVAGRAIQGLGASGMGMMVNIIICDTFSLRDRALYLAITSIVWAVGSAVGPVIGGVFTTELNWRWCFWINLPIGAAVFLALFFFLDVPSPNTPVLVGLRAVDWSGSVLIIGSVLMILLGLDFGDIVFPWSSATVINLLVFGSVVLGIFVLNEWKVARNPVIPLRLFTSWSTVAAYAVFAFNSYVFIGLAYYLPFYSQAVLGVNPLMSGVHLIPLIVSSSLAAAFAGLLIQKTGKYLPVMYVAQVLLTLGMGLFVDLKFEQNLGRLFTFEVLAGIGIGMNIEGPILAAQAAATSLDTAAVISTMGFGRSVATAVSVVVGGVIFQNEMNANNVRLQDQLGQVAGNFTGDQASANLDFIHTLEDREQDIVRRAYFDSLRTVWIMYVAFAGLSTLLILLIRGHHLSRDANEVVLGVDRDKKVGQTTETTQEADLGPSSEASPMSRLQKLKHYRKRNLQCQHSG